MASFETVKERCGNLLGQIIPDPSKSRPNPASLSFSLVAKSGSRDIPFPFPFHGPVQIFSPPEKVTRVLDQILVDVGDEPQKLFKAERQSRHKNHHHRKTPLRMNAFFFNIILHAHPRLAANLVQSKPIKVLRRVDGSLVLPPRQHLNMVKVYHLSSPLSS